MDDKFVPGPDPRLAEAGPQTILDNTNPDKGMPHVAAPGLGYALPPRNDGMIYARPFICTSVDSRNQHVSGYVFWEPEDRVPNPGVGNLVYIGPYSAFVRDIPMGNPSQFNTVHWLAANYMGRSDGPGLTPAEQDTVVKELIEPVVAGQVNAATDAQQVDPDPADRNKDGVTTPAEQRQFDKHHKPHGS